MTRGGARVNSGPPPDPNALRRDRAEDKAGWTVLPAAGRSGRTPKWPLLPDPTDEVERRVLVARVEQLELKSGAGDLEQLRERLATVELRMESVQKLEKTIWRDLWRTPQATQWERLGWFREVALYVRLTVKSELGSLQHSKEARQQSDRLGLNPAALLRLRWTIGPAAVIAPAAAASSRRPRRSARDRFTVHDGGREE